jgi:hypothetical protein
VAAELARHRDLWRRAQHQDLRRQTTALLLFYHHVALFYHHVALELHKHTSSLAHIRKQSITGGRLHVMQTSALNHMHMHAMHIHTLHAHASTHTPRAYTRNGWPHGPLAARRLMPRRHGLGRRAQRRDMWRKPGATSAATFAHVGREPYTSAPRSMAPRRVISTPRSTAPSSRSIF